MNKPLVRTLVIFVVVLIGSGLLVYLVLERSAPGRDVISDRPVTEAQPHRNAIACSVNNRNGEGRVGRSLRFSELISRPTRRLRKPTAES